RAVRPAYPEVMVQWPAAGHGVGQGHPGGDEVIGLDEAQPAMHRTVEFVRLDSQDLEAPAVDADPVAGDVHFPDADTAGMQGAHDSSRAADIAVGRVVV